MDTPGGKPGTTSKTCGKGDIEMMSEEALIGIWKDWLTQDPEDRRAGHRALRTVP